MRRISLSLLLLVLAFPALAAGSARDTKLTLVAYSTPKEAYVQLIPAFQKTHAGQGVSFSQSYGASGDQSRAVDGGLHADVVAFSLEPEDLVAAVADVQGGGAHGADSTERPSRASLSLLTLQKECYKSVTQDRGDAGVDEVEPSP